MSTETARPDGSDSPSDPEAGISPIGVVDDPAFDRHRSVEHHPERPERLFAARAALRATTVQTRPVAAREATREELSRVHHEAYLDELASLAGQRGHLDADTYLAPDSVASALRAAGGGVALVDALLDGELTRGLALLRPPGHHARAGQAMGFCVINNVAVAAAHAIARGLERVLVVDWDVHHGNGTQEMFYGDPRVLYVSLHQWPFYPGTGSAAEVGSGAGEGYSVNVPFSAGARHADYAAAFERVILPVADAYAPQLVLVSAGFDAHKDDPLASMQLEADSYAWMTQRLVEVADQHAGGRLALFLEGGYNLSALEHCLGACLSALASVEGQPGRATSTTRDGELERATLALRTYWSVLRSS
ncbi:MAG TPA: histone deacetylase [Polyangiaceae bacterium]|nr:histone deacetylase [Polyangiaceae bacterium]